jgi:CheY-like chemotaxis protein
MKARILIVDDEPLNLLILEDLLAEQYAVHSDFLIQTDVSLAPHTNL